MVLSKEHAVEYLAKAPVAFIGTISDVIPGITNYSLPPIHHYTLRLHNIRPLRGSVSATEFGYRQHGAGPSARAANGEEEEDVREPMRGVTYLACSSDGKYINDLVELDASIIERLVQSSRMPVGWSRQSNGQLESPWQHSHARQPKWYNDQQFAHCERCARSGRPALITADDVAFSCEPVKAAHTKEYQNPDGDGVFRLTVTNNGHRAVSVPALLRDPRSKQILWEESVFVITDAGSHFFPGHGHAREAEPSVLQPHESVSALLDTLTLRGLHWPQGGWRLKPRFCLGDKAVEGNYYYYTDHHDPIRKKAEAKKTAVIH